jgi:hypothetical protein
MQERNVMEQLQNSGCEAQEMARQGYKAPVREGKASILIYLDAEIRDAYKVAMIERGTSMQEDLVRYITEQSATTLRRIAKIRKAESDE